MIVEADLERAWGVLTPPSIAALNSFPLTWEAGGLSARVALDKASLRHVLVPVGDMAVDDRSADTLGLRKIRLKFGAVTADYLDVSCNDSELHHEFNLVILDVLVAAQSLESAPNPLVGVLDRWRRLFARFGRVSLSHAQQLGLFAELSLLDNIVQSEPAFAMDSWTGPLRQPHDFELSGGCVEVKGVGLDASEVRIHGLDQLDQHDDRSLHLVVMRIESDAPDGLGLDALVRRISSAARDVDVFYHRLAAAGVGVGSPGLESGAFSLRELLIVPIVTEVPRLINASIDGAALPSGVRVESYRVEIDALRPFAQPSDLSSLTQALVE